MPEEGDTCLAEFHAVGTLLDPVRDERLILDTGCVKQLPLNVNSRHYKRQEVREDRLTLHRRHREIVRVCHNSSMMFTIQAARAAGDGSTSTKPDHRGSLHRLT